MGSCHKQLTLANHYFDNVIVKLTSENLVYSNIQCKLQ